MAPRGQLPDPQVGEPAKVWLPGESPWAECIAMHGDGSWDGKIVNKLFNEFSEHERARVMKGAFGTARPPEVKHTYRQGQVVRFRREVTDDYEIWVPA